MAGREPLSIRPTGEEGLALPLALHALTRDRELAFQAMFSDPTNHLPIDDAWAMFNRMLQASREFLPGWAID